MDTDQKSLLGENGISQELETWVLTLVYYCYFLF